MLDLKEQLYTENQLSSRWNISVKKLQADRLKGNSIPFIKLGRLVRYKLSDIEEFERKHTRYNTSEEGGVS